MAYDWIKVRKKLATDGRVRYVCEECHASRVTVLGALLLLWFLGDDEADADGVLFGYTAKSINELVGVDGFCESLPSDWIDLTGKWVKLPSYQQHNGKTAKVRAENTERQRHAREGKNVTDMSREVRDNLHTKSATREEKNKNKDKSKNPPTPLTASFDDFWGAYPRKVGKQDAAKAFAKLKPDAELLARMLTAITAQHQTADWQKDGGQYIPHPATWLNGKRWEDVVTLGALPIHGTTPARLSRADTERLNAQSAECWVSMHEQQVDSDPLILQGEFNVV